MGDIKVSVYNKKNGKEKVVNFGNDRSAAKQYFNDHADSIKKDVVYIENGNIQNTNWNKSNIKMFK